MTDDYVGCLVPAPEDMPEELIELSACGDAEHGVTTCYLAYVDRALFTGDKIIPFEVWHAVCAALRKFVSEAAKS